MEWLDRAKEFQLLAGDRLSRPETRELEKDDFPLISLPPPRAEVRLLELPGVYRVTHDYQDSSHFRYFMDGAQRTFLWRYYNFEGFKVPLYLHFSGAAVVERKTPRHFVPRHYKFKTSIILPGFVYEEFEGLGGIVDSGAREPWNLGDIRACAEVKSRGLRQELEIEVMNDFLELQNGLLLKDGNIAHVASNRVVGVVKNHSTLYLQGNHPELQLKVWNMDRYSRSPLFSLRLLDGKRVSSFYLRLHQPLEPERGLIRVEYSHQDPQEIAEWLIAESMIVAQSPRWHHQLFPIQKCEDFIKSQLPTRRLVNAVAGGTI